MHGRQRVGSSLRRFGGSPLLRGGAAAAMLAAFIYVATHNITSPGLYYDEVDFVNAAIGGTASNGFISARVLGVPVMVMPYIGALKSYLYYPIFGAFGVSALTVRLPSILVAALGLFAWYKVGALVMKWRLSALGMLAAMAVDPAYIFQAKLDWGPVVLQVLFSGLTTYALLRALHSTTRAAVRVWLPAAYAFMLLGLFNKLNFIWTIDALGLATLLVYPRQVRSWIDQGAVFFLPFGAALVLLASAVRFLILPLMGGPGPDMSILTKIQYTLGLYTSTMRGGAVFQYVTGRILTSPSWVNQVQLGVTLSWVGVLVVTARRLRGSQRMALRTTAFFLVIFAAIAVQIVVTKQATGPHHVMALWPINLVLVFLMVEFIAVSVWAVRRPGTAHTWGGVLWGRERGSLVRRCVAVVALAVPFLALVMSGGMADAAYNAAFSAPAAVSAEWSPSIYQLSEYVNATYTKTGYVIFPDWGIANQVFALAESDVERARILDAWPWFAGNGPTAAVSHWTCETYFAGRTDIVVVFTDTEAVPGTIQNFGKFLRSERLILSREGTIPTKGEPVYSVYVFKGADCT